VVEQVISQQTPNALRKRERKAVRIAVVTLKIILKEPLRLDAKGGRSVAAAVNQAIILQRHETLITSLKYDISRSVY
jgi:hypothetical protein